MLDLPATPEAASWAFRLLRLRQPGPDDAPGPDETLGALRRRLLAAEAETRPDPVVAGAPVSRDAAIWAYRVFLGREPENEAVIAACVGLPDLAQLAANFRVEREFLAQDGMRPEGEQMIDVLGLPAQFRGLAADPYFRNLNTLGPSLERLAALARRVARARPGPFQALDIGACLGVTAVALARALPGHRIVAVEAAPRLAELVRRNVEANGCAAAVAVEHAAVGAANGEAAPFREEGFSAGSHLLTPADRDAATDWVPMTTLAALAERYALGDLGFVKLDIEGFERHALEGGLDLLRRSRAVVHMEFNSWAQLAMSDTNPRHFFEWLGRSVPHIHALGGPDGQTWTRLENWAALPFLHRNLVERRAVEDIVLSWDGAAWATVAE